MDDIGTAGGFLVIICILGGAMTTIFIFAPFELNWTLDLELELR